MMVSSIKPGFLECLQEFADVAVDIAARTEVCAACIANLIHRQRFVPQVVNLEQTLGVRIKFGLRRGFGQWDVGVVVHIPESLGNGVRVVWVSHRNGQAERLIAILPDVIEQILLGLEHHLFVEIQLIGAYARPGLQHRRHVVKPGRTHVWLVPVHRPAVIGRVNVAGQPFFIAMQLIRATEMHLARQRGAVAESTQVVGISRYIGGEIGRVVVGADLARQLTADQGKTRRRAQWAVAISGVEHHAFGGEAAEIGQFDGRRAVERQHWRGHLIGHDEKNILALHVIAAFHSEYLCESAAIEHVAHAICGKAHARQ